MRDMIEKVVGFGVAALVFCMLFESFFAGVLHP